MADPVAQHTTGAGSDEGEWLYGGLAYPVMPDPPAPVLKAFRQHRTTGVVEWMDVPEPEGGLPVQTARQAWGLEPKPGETPPSPPPA